MRSTLLVLAVLTLAACGPTDAVIDKPESESGSTNQGVSDPRCPPAFWTQDCGHKHGVCPATGCHMHYWEWNYSAQKDKCFLRKTDTYVCSSPLPQCGGCVNDSQCPGNQECHQKVIGPPTNPTCTQGFCKERRNSAAELTAVVPITPVRVVDTRNNGTRLENGTWRGFNLPQLPAWATGVVINVTAVDPDNAGFITISPQTVINASTVNFNAWTTTANLTIVSLDAGGELAAFAGGANTDLLLDVVGYVTTEGSADWNSSLWFNSMTPVRLMDSRVTGTMVCAGQPVKVNVSHPANGGLRSAKALFANVTLLSPDQSTFARAYAWGSSSPFVSTVNAGGGAPATPNLTLVRTALDEFGNPSIAIELGAGCAHVLVDAMGFFTPNGEPVELLPAPRRIFDTRTSRPLNAFETLTIGPITGGLTGGMFNITATGSQAAGFLSIFPGDAAFSGTSNVNFNAGETRAVMGATRLSSGGMMRIYNGSPGQTHVLIDMLGGFKPDPRF